MYNINKVYSVLSRRCVVDNRFQPAMASHDMDYKLHYDTRIYTDRVAKKKNF